MHRFSALQRTEDMRLELYNDLALRDPSFVATLPFDQNGIKRYITDGILQRTKKRWAWFATAQEINPSLGTLCYLPSEIRRLVWQAVLQCRDTLSSDGIWEYEKSLGSVFNVSAYYFGFGRRSLVNSNAENLRLVSLSVKAEYEENFLKIPFRFNQALNLTAFLERMPQRHLSLLTSIELGVCGLYNIESWMAPIAHLPRSLRLIHFRIHPTIPGWYEGQVGRESLRSLEKLIRCVSSTVPDARVVTTSTNEEPLSHQCQEFFSQIFQSPPTYEMETEP